MKKLLALLVFLTPTASFADITSSISSSVKLEVSAAATAADRIGNSYSVSGTGDTIGTSLTTGEVSAFGDLTSTSGGTATNLAGTVDNHVITITAGSQGTSATGQYVTTVTVD